MKSIVFIIIIVLFSVEAYDFSSSSSSLFDSKSTNSFSFTTPIEEKPIVSLYSKPSFSEPYENHHVITFADKRPGDSFAFMTAETISPILGSSSCLPPCHDFNTGSKPVFHTLENSVPTLLNLDHRINDFEFTRTLDRDEEEYLRGHVKGGLGSSWIKNSIERKFDDYKRKKEQEKIQESLRINTEQYENNIRRKEMFDDFVTGYKNLFEEETKKYTDTFIEYQHSIEGGTAKLDKIDEKHRMFLGNDEISKFITRVGGGKVAQLVTMSDMRSEIIDKLNEYKKKHENVLAFINNDEILKNELEEQLKKTRHDIIVTQEMRIRSEPFNKFDYDIPDISIKEMKLTNENGFMKKLERLEPELF